MVAMERVRYSDKQTDIKGGGATKTNNISNLYYSSNVRVDMANVRHDEDSWWKELLKEELIFSRKDPVMSGIPLYLETSMNMKVILPQIKFDLLGPSPPAYYYNQDSKFTAIYSTNDNKMEDVIFSLIIKDAAFESNVQSNFELIDGPDDNNIAQLSQRNVTALLKFGNIETVVSPGLFRSIKAWNEISYAISCLSSDYIIGDDAFNEGSHGVQENLTPTLFTSKSDINNINSINLKCVV